MKYEEEKIESLKPSVRLRHALFKLAEKRGIESDDFEKFYLEKMEVIIQMVKNKINDN